MIQSCVINVTTVAILTRLLSLIPKHGTIQSGLGRLYRKLPLGYEIMFRKPTKKETLSVQY